jgi:hypothetical protein
METVLTGCRILDSGCSILDSRSLSFVLRPLREKLGCSWPWVKIRFQRGRDLPQESAEFAKRRRELATKRHRQHMRERTPDANCTDLHEEVAPAKHAKDAKRGRMKENSQTNGVNRMGWPQKGAKGAEDRKRGRTPDANCANLREAGCTRRPIWAEASTPTLNSKL